MTMLDLLVSMSIMAVVGAILTGGIVQLYRMTTRAEANSAAQSQISAAVLRLDRQVRYATRINVASATSMTYEVVEKGTNRCYQTRVTGGRLQQNVKTVGGSYGTWRPLASGLTSAVFTYVAPADANDHQRLRIRLTAASPGGAAVTKATDVTFTAVNTTRTSPTSAC